MARKKVKIKHPEKIKIVTQNKETSSTFKGDEGDVAVVADNSPFIPVPKFKGSTSKSINEQVTNVLKIIGLVFAVLVPIAGIIWWAATLTNNVGSIKSDVDAMKIKIQNYFTKSDDNNRSINDINTKIETLKEEQKNNKIDIEDLKKKGANFITTGEKDVQ